MPIKEKNRCEHCGSIIDKRKICLNKSTLRGLWKVFLWCKQTGSNEFVMRDARELLGAVNYTKFSDLVYFGGLIYKHGKAHYGLNMQRCDAFFRGKLSVHRFVWKDPITGDIERSDEDLVTIDGIPSIMQFLDEDGLYIAEYKPRCA